MWSHRGDDRRVQGVDSGSYRWSCVPLVFRILPYVGAQGNSGNDNGDDVVVFAIRRVDLS